MVRTGPGTIILSYQKHLSSKKIFNLLDKIEETLLIFLLVSNSPIRAFEKGVEFLKYLPNF